ncbi:hypothetical protein [Rhizobium chutanense]|nr:hypothetical protein [Rhizobium chutanense]
MQRMGTILRGHALPEAGRSAQRRQMAAAMMMEPFRYRHPAFVKT